MDEATLANKIRQTITAPADSILPPPPVEDDSRGQAAEAVSTRLDDLTQYKLQDYFGEQYKDTDEIKRQQAEYIYKHVSEMVENPEYGFVLAKIRDLERVIGLDGRSNRMYRLYQWLKLDNVRRNIDAEIGAITNG